MQTLTIGQLAKQAHVHIETIRYYERRRLIPEPPRRESGYRQYPLEAVERIRFIRRAQELGFSLKEIVELLSLRIDPETTSADIKRRAQAKIADIDAKVRDLEQMKTALMKLAAACRGRGPTSECPILETLASDGRKQ
ncbi:MAG: heavy metal-responsive transcriptional regulator [Candidatus Methylomirabilota bacterium]|nr:MerR family DNA-binding protein [Candidatus Methylomirabilis sp.]NJD69281.1 MerR family transcriptional regulator [candidate division NC10 bacterium]PWB47851.1 MAG: heavy metal-responsive transcriptional regulator [candidate division NC10 bacterium]